jgi:hypothetical protein
MAHPPWPGAVRYRTITYRQLEHALAPLVEDVDLGPSRRGALQQFRTSVLASACGENLLETLEELRGLRDVEHQRLPRAVRARRLRKALDAFAQGDGDD